MSAQIPFNQAVAILTERMPTDAWAVGLAKDHSSRHQPLPDDLEEPAGAVACFLREAIERGLCRCRGLSLGAIERCFIDPVRMHDFQIMPGVGEPQEPDGEPEAIAIARTFSAATGVPPTGDYRYDALRFFENEIAGLRDVFQAWHGGSGNWTTMRPQQNIPMSVRSSRRGSPLRGSKFKEAVSDWYRDVWVGANGWELAGHKTSPGEDDDLKAARSEFGDLVSRDMIRKLRQEYAPAEWKLPGRRSA